METGFRFFDDETDVFEAADLVVAAEAADFFSKRRQTWW